MKKKKNNDNPSILDLIKSGQIKKRPKWHFVLSKILNIFAVIIIALTAIYLISFLIFTFKFNGLLLLPGLGLKGTGLFLASFPWLIIIVIGLIVIGLEIFISKISFAYKKPLIYSLLAILLVSITFGYLLSTSEIHPRLMNQAINKELPIGGQFYRNYGLRSSENFHLGQVEEINSDSSFQLDLREGETVRVIVNKNTKMPIKKEISTGDQVVVIGEIEEGEIVADGIRILGYRAKFNSNPNIKGKKHLK